MFGSIGAPSYRVPERAWCDRSTRVENECGSITASVTKLLFSLVVWQQGEQAMTGVGVIFQYVLGSVQTSHFEICEKFRYLTAEYGTQVQSINFYGSASWGDCDECGAEVSKQHSGVAVVSSVCENCVEGSGYGINC